MPPEVAPEDHCVATAIAYALERFAGERPVVTASRAGAGRNHALWLNYTLAGNGEPELFFGLHADTLAWLHRAAATEVERSQQELAESLGQLFVEQLAIEIDRSLEVVGLRQTHPAPAFELWLLEATIANGHIVRFYTTWNRAFEQGILAAQPAPPPPAAPAVAPPPPPQAQPRPASDMNLGVLQGLELPLTLSFGSTEMPLAEALRLAPGSLIDFQQSLDQPVTLMVNGKPVACGQLVVVDGKYAVRITSVADPRTGQLAGRV